MKECIIKIDNVGRMVIPKQARQVLKLSDSKLVQMYIERDKIIIKKYAPLLNEILLASKICSSLASVTNAHCLVCDNERVVCCSSSALDELKLKRLTGDFKSLTENGMPVLLNQADGSTLVQICKDCSFDYYSLCAIPLESEQKIGYLLLLNFEKDRKFDVQTLELITVVKNLIEGIL